MTVGYLRLHLLIPNSLSLKDKRKVVQSLKARLRNAFNISVVECANNLWNDTELWIAGVSQTREGFNNMIHQILQMIDNDGRAQIIEHESDLIY